MVSTTIETVDGWTRMVYHNTCVAQYNPQDNLVVFNTGGYSTTTTKKRMNQFCKMFGIPLRVHQSKHVWYLTGAITQQELKNNQPIQY